MTDPRADFIEASFWHGSLERAEAILAAHPEIASSDIHTAAILGDDVAVRRFLKINPASATEKGGPRDVDALTYLCFSTYLQRDHARGDGFVRAATALLDAGASANTGFYDVSHKPSPEWEPVLYGAAGVAHHAPMTRLLLERGANPNDEEVVYHSPETYDNAAMKLLVETRKLTEDSLTLMLIRKHDWHDYEGVNYLLQQGIDVNRDRLRGWRPLHHAIVRDNALAIIELLLDRDADPMQPQDGQTAAALAARRGRGDVLSLFDRRQRAVEFSGVDQIVAACARHDANAVRNTSARHPELKHALIAEGGKVLVEFAANGNTPGVELLLDLGVPVTALHTQGDGYWDLAKDTTALHAAAWRAQHDTVQLLIARGAQVDAKDAKGRTALAQAVRACVDSYWTSRRSPDSVAALLRAGASIAGVKYPSGYAEVDELLRQHGARA